MYHLKEEWIKREMITDLPSLFDKYYMRSFCIEKYDHWKIRNINSGQIWSNMDLFNSMYVHFNPTDYTNIE